MEADDLLVFELRDGSARLVGGTGRGAGWAGTVELAAQDEPHLAEVVARQRIVRIEGDGPTRIIGPYWAAHASLVPVGADHLVVIGASRLPSTSSGELIRSATDAVAAVGEIPSSKLLADELEVIHAVQQLTEVATRSVAEAARHAARVAAEALSCEIGAVLMEHNGRAEVYGAGTAWPDVADDQVLVAALHELAQRAVVGPVIEQDFEAVGASGVRIVSCYALSIGHEPSLGALVVGHTGMAPRGFTNLCRRVGRALADAADVSLALARTHEELTAQRDRYAREARTDSLTGLTNRIGWDEELELQDARRQRYGHPIALLAIDVDGLKEANDGHGHAAGDDLLREAARILRCAVRGGDVVARVGGDEFAALLNEADADAARAVAARIEDGCAEWSRQPGSLRLGLSVGWAVPEMGESLHAAFDRADKAMYVTKQRGAVTER